MRFSEPSSESRRPAPYAARGRLWLLVAMLAGVLWMMDKLTEPETAARLGRILQLSAGNEAATQNKQQPVGVERSQVDRVREQRDSAVAQVRVETNELSAGGSAELLNQHVNGDAWSEVRDNAPFSDAEQPAWFDALAAMQTADARQLTGQSLGETTYAQLRSQPAEYRGRIVTIHGKAVQAVAKQPAPNELGIESYFRLAIAPRGGGQWPIFAYCLSLPEGFPRGDKLHEDVAVNGIFFKNWSYPHDDGFGLAPVLVAHSLHWQPRQYVATQSPADQSIAAKQIVAVVGCILGAAVVVILAAVQTRRSSTRRQTNVSSDELAALGSIDVGANADGVAPLADAEGKPL